MSKYNNVLNVLTKHAKHKLAQSNATSKTVRKQVQGYLSRMSDGEVDALDYMIHAEWFTSITDIRIATKCSAGEAKSARQKIQTMCVTSDDERTIALVNKGTEYAYCHYGIKLWLCGEAPSEESAHTVLKSTEGQAVAMRANRHGAQQAIADRAPYDQSIEERLAKLELTLKQVSIAV